MATLVELVEMFTSKTTALKQCIDLRNAAHSSACLCDLKAIDNEVTQTEQILEELKERIKVEKQKLEKGKVVLQIVQQYQDRISHVANNLPTHLPSTERESKQKPSLKQLSKTVNQEPKPEKRPRITHGNTDDSIPTLQYITVDDFETVPKYMKGRITYKQVNNIIDGINKTINSKYKILSLPRSAMGEHVMKQYRAFKEAETNDTEGQYFVVDGDIKTYSSLKLDKTCRSVLTILRHTGRLKELRSGGFIRYVVNIH